MRRAWLILIVLVPLGAAVFILTVAALIPGDFEEGILRKELNERANITFSAGGFKKVFPFGFEADRVTLLTAGGQGFLRFDKLRVKLNVPYILIGKINIDMDGAIRSGAVRSTATLRRDGVDLSVKADGIDAADVPALREQGFKGMGVLSGNADLLFRNNSCAEGTVNADAKGVDLNGLNVPGASLLFKEKVNVTLAADTKGCRARVKSLWVEGRVMAVKLYGHITPAKKLSGSSFDLTLEILPKKGAADMVNILMILAQYRKSSNYYSLRIRGTAEKPVISP